MLCRITWEQAHLKGLIRPSNPRSNNGRASFLHRLTSLGTAIDLRHSNRYPLAARAAAAAAFAAAICRLDDSLIDVFWGLCTLGRGIQEHRTSGHGGKQGPHIVCCCVSEIATFQDRGGNKERPISCAILSDGGRNSANSGAEISASMCSVVVFLCFAARPRRAWATLLQAVGFEIRDSSVEVMESERLRDTEHLFIASVRRWL